VHANHGCRRGWRQQGTTGRLPPACFERQRQMCYGTDLMYASICPGRVVGCPDTKQGVLTRPRCQVAWVAAADARASTFQARGSQVSAGGDAITGSHAPHNPGSRGQGWRGLSMAGLRPPCHHPAAPPAGCRLALTSAIRKAPVLYLYGGSDEHGTSA